MKRHLNGAAALVLGVVLLGCSRAEGDKRAASVGPGVERTGFPDWALALYAPVPEAAGSSDGAKADLGRALYYETLLSFDRDASCSTCHPLAHWGTTSRPLLTGNTRRASRLDIPTVYNAATEVALFWDGRAHDVEEQVKESIKSPLEMAMVDEATVVTRLRESAKYRAAFQAAFPDEKEPVTFGNIARALGAFEKRLVTPSRWDQFLRGNRDVLSREEKQGFETFVDRGCSDCHNGPAVGGRMYQIAGEVSPWPLQSDSGAYSKTRKAADLFRFRVPPLRNIEMTGPYFDTGGITDLPEAVRLMARYQRGLTLSESDVQGIVAWLKTLTGTVPSATSNPGR